MTVSTIPEAAEAGLVDEFSYEIPHTFCESAWIEHAPFAFWLVKALRPKTLVELGTHNGYSYFTMCQAVKALGLQTQCFAVDTWRGDEHAGWYSDEVWHKVVAINAANYAEFSSLIRSTFRDALPRFTDTSIDLIHFDGRHRFEDIHEDFTTWMPKLAPGAVALFHDTQVRESDFGVYRFWAELRERFPTFEFIHCNGLGVLSLDGNVTERVAALYWVDKQPALRDNIRSIYATLGGKLSAHYLHRLHREVVAADNAHRKAQLEAERQTKLAGVLRSQLAMHDPEIAHLQAKLNTAAHALGLGTDKVVDDTTLRFGTSINGQPVGLRDFGKHLPVSLAAQMAWRAIRYSARRKLRALKGKPAFKQLPPPANSHLALLGLVVGGGDPNAVYADWTRRFELPRAGYYEHLLKSERDGVLVVVKFSEISLSGWRDAMASLDASIGVRWRALFCVDNSIDPNEWTKVAREAAFDRRIYTDLGALDVTDETIIVVMSGSALPVPHGIRELVDAVTSQPSKSLCYADEDRIDDAGRVSDPWFKPRFSRILSRAGTLLGGFVALKPSSQSEARRILSALSATTIPLDRWMASHVAKLADDEITNVHHVLFHDRHPAEPIAANGQVPVGSEPPVSIIIPTRDRWDLLKDCLESLYLTDWPLDKLEIVVVDNGSTDEDCLTGLKEHALAGRIGVIRDDKPFNYSRLNNIGVAASHGALIVLLNNDTKAIDRKWLRKMAYLVLKPGVGAVGPKLIYPDGTVQHGGIVMGVGGFATHAHWHLHRDEPGYRGLANITREVSAVTGACLAVSRKNYDAVGGLKEAFCVAFNDVVLCLDLMDMGLRNVYLAEPLFVHHESKTRGYDDNKEKREIARMESMLAWSMHRSRIKDDPFYSPNLSLEGAYQLSFEPRRKNLAAPNGDSLHILNLSSTYANGHGVAVVLDQLTRELRKRGHRVTSGGLLSDNDYESLGLEAVRLVDPREAARWAAENGVDVIIVHTPPFFSVAGWTGAHPKTIAYDYGEPPSELFADAEQRRHINRDKDVALLKFDRVFAISDAIRAESRTPVDAEPNIIAFAEEIERLASESEI